MKSKHIAIIPARSGSKGLKDKNIKLLLGKPMIAYTIEAAIASGIFDEVFVSTDSEDYAMIARNYGATIPFLRNANLATDTASTWNVIRDDLASYQKLGKEFDYVTVLQPTSPLRTVQNIKESFELLKRKQAHAVVSVCKCEHSPLICNTLDASFTMNQFINSNLVGARQQLSTYYRINGAIYMLQTSELYTGESIYSDHCYAYIMTKEHSVDIDDFYDFIYAEMILKLQDRKETIL